MTRRIHICLLVVSACLLAAACREGDIKVTALDFNGHSSFPDEVIARVLETKAAGWLPWASWRPFQQGRFESDLARLKAFYADQGYPNMRVRKLDVHLSSDGKSVKLRVDIEEGEPLVIERVGLEGFDGLPDELTRELESLPIAAGRPRSNLRIREARDRALGALREHGYPHAKVDVLERPGASEGHVVIVLSATPGPETRFGSVTVAGLKRMKHVVVKRAITFTPGDLYRQSQVDESQRRLSSMEAFQFALLAPAEAKEAKEAKPDVLPMTATVTEALPHRFEFGVGYGTEDRVRGSVEWRHLNFFGNASQLVVNARYSKVLQSTSLTYQHPYLFRTGGSLSVRGGASWKHEATYESRTAGGRLAMAHAFGGSRRRPDGSDAYQTTVAYRNEFLTYRVTPDALSALGRVNELIALGLDPVTGRGRGTVAGLEFDVERAVVDDAGNPRKGAIGSVHYSHVAPWLGGTFRYDEMIVEGRSYVSVGKATLATRVQFGTIAASNSATVPFSERYFLGGTNKLRGWGRFEVSPQTVDGVPIGGRTTFDASAEVRFGILSPLSAVIFLDAGNVWGDGFQANLRDLRYAAGPGLRWHSIVGVVRADFGYQLTPLSNLLIRGETKSRRWRLHLSFGHAF